MIWCGDPNDSEEHDTTMTSGAYLAVGKGVGWCEDICDPSDLLVVWVAPADPNVIIWDWKSHAEFYYVIPCDWLGILGLEPELIKVAEATKVNRCPHW